jgi:hypothetical protein
MSATNIHPDLLDVALDRVEGVPFERFCQDFLGAIEGRDFVPLGGVHDGGADGLFECGVNRIYYQFTREENHRAKIRRTVDRLAKFGREVKTLYYLTARAIPHIDREEDLLTAELDVIIKIRDRKYIASHLNDSVGTIAAYDNHLSVFTQFLSRLSRKDNRYPSPHVHNPAAYVFLQHEATNRLGNRKLVHSLADTLILWALSETDPDEGIFLTRNEIDERIFSQFPWASKLLKSQISPRLEAMRNKKMGGREVRWYKKEDKYCLPYETRQVIALENSTDEAFQIRFLDELKASASELFDADEGEYQKVADLCLKVVHSVFERQGLLFAHFLVSEEESQPPPVVADCIDDALNVSEIPAELREGFRDYVETVIRKVFYSGSPSQRAYLANLSRTYVLLFTLQAEPRIVDFFSTMSASFSLYVGSDIIVKALSERFLPREDQVARNLLRMAADAGVSMYLSQCVLEEVYTHIRATYYEFINFFADVEPYITTEIARNSDRILIRAYFYAKDNGRVDGWKRYLSHFISYENIPRIEGQEELRKYLVAEYGLTFTDNAELESLSDSAKVKLLAETILDQGDKENEALAYNTALLVHGIYGIRRKNRETSGASEFGLRTWWMTNQSRIAKHTVETVRSNGAQYIMRPEFLLNFIALSPSCEEVRETFGSMFPSVFGIQLGRRLKEDVFHRIMSEVREWKDFEPGRITALMSDLSDKLKTDRLRRYERKLDDGMP